MARTIAAIVGAATAQIAYTASKGGVLAMSREQTRAELEIRAQDAANNFEQALATRRT